MGKVDPDDPRPPYQQVADDLRAAIQTGTLAPGDRLPKQSELANDYGVSIGTVKSALGVLRDEALITSRQGEGSWVRRSRSDGSAANVDSGSADVSEMLTEVLHRLDGLSQRIAAIEQRLSRD
ncbi:GntR family transcriptional regulator [Saccharopolyspora rosea]|uniref:GntR family transcriptional regulator n=1 Tax=Saccharopolyspora rosea TaxID=524884 RepID=UPI0021DA247D|nr:winged helix-turn-helix domain-containing protein [Saccharopolyspora rosea]